MEEKLVCKIGPSRTDQSDSCLAIDWFEVNKRVHEMLDLVKNSIGNDRRWDRVKRYFNLYELVSSSVHDIPSFAAYAPTSRSYFKLTELLVDHAADLTTPCASRSAFLCDAPGGFVEAYVMYRRRRDREQARGPGDWLGKDVMHAISLVGDACGGSGAPGWRLPRDLMRNNNIHLHGGGDEGDGDLYSLSNIDAFVIRAAPRSCDLVTADGGFDFSVDFNSQEKTSLRLLVSEVYTALLLQADGGCFLIKVYDLRLPATLRLLWLLHSCYTGGLVIDKPSSSRAANSEKFVVCKTFLRTGYVDRMMPTSCTAELSWPAIAICICTWCRSPVTRRSLTRKSHGTLSFDVISRSGSAIGIIRSIVLTSEISVIATTERRRWIGSTVDGMSYCTGRMYSASGWIETGDGRSIDMGSAASPTGSNEASGATSAASADICWLATTLCTELNAPAVAAGIAGGGSVRELPKAGMPATCACVLRLLNTVSPATGDTTAEGYPLAASGSAANLTGSLNLMPACPCAGAKDSASALCASRGSSRIDSLSIFGSEWATPVSRGMAMMLNTAQQENAARTLRG
ncbi:MAG: hypothetical protein WDW38_006593 [Sanguina aurantia]